MAAGKILFDALGLLTPEQISQLSVVSCGVKARNLSDVVWDDLYKQEGAKILPFAKPHNQPKEDNINLHPVENQLTDKKTKLVGVNEKDLKAPNHQLDQPIYVESSSDSVDTENSTSNSSDLNNTAIKMEQTAKKVVEEIRGMDVKKMASSSFILIEKELLKKSQNKLKSIEIIKLYRNTSEFNIKQEKKNNSDLSKNPNVGVLINKKQA